MTPDDLALDPALLLRDGTLIVYRLARKRHANLSGIGAALCPGRWNRETEEALYTSMNQSTCVLERLAHTGGECIPTNLVMMKMSLPGKWVQDGGSLLHQTSEISITVCATLAETRPYVEQCAHNRPFGLAVPSVIVPEWNIVLYPGTRGLGHHVALQSVMPYEFDPRHFPEGKPLEKPG